MIVYKAIPIKSIIKRYKWRSCAAVYLSTCRICLYAVILAHCGRFISVCGKLLACAPCVRSGGIYGGTWSTITSVSTRARWA